MFEKAFLRRFIPVSNIEDGIANYIPSDSNHEIILYGQRSLIEIVLETVIY